MAEQLKCVIVQPATPLPKAFPDFWAEAASVVLNFSEGRPLSLSWLSQWFNFSTHPWGSSPLCLSPALGSKAPMERESVSSLLPLPSPTGTGCALLLAVRALWAWQLGKGFCKVQFFQKKVVLASSVVFLSVKSTGIQMDGF